MVGARQLGIVIVIAVVVVKEVTRYSPATELTRTFQPIFHAGKNKRRVEITESRQRQVLYGYERVILEAFRETEDALVSYRAAGQQRQAQAGRVSAERKVLELAELRYRGGVAAYLEVLDAQRSLFGAELDEAETIGGHLVSLVRLYKALGGGWSPERFAQR